MTQIISNNRVHVKKVDSNLDRIKFNVKNWQDYFQPNFARYRDFMNFVFKSSLTKDDLALNSTLGRPNFEFNIMESFISRLLGEFAKQEPGLQISQNDFNQGPVNPGLIHVIEGIIRNIFFEANRDNMEYEIYRDCLVGGYSCYKIYTDYAHSLSFQQKIFMEKVYDPTLIIFDTLAKESHKGDGRFSGELFPKTYDEIKEKYGSDAVKDLIVNKGTEGFNWSYYSNNEKIFLIAEYYEKKIKKRKIVQVRGKGVMTVKDYEKMVDEWNGIEQPPIVIGKERETEISELCRYTFVQNKVLEYADTDLKYLPHIFVDGNSVLLRDSGGGNAQQMTRPMMYNMKSTQKFKNLAGTMIANHIENTPQSQWLIPKQGIPAEYAEFWLTPQKASLLAYDPFLDNDPQKQLPLPQPVIPRQIPPEFIQIFMSLDQTSQTILGSYDAALGINDNQLSGKAIRNGAIQSHAASMPYYVNYIKSLNQASLIIMDLIPKYIAPGDDSTVRTISIRNKSGKENQIAIDSNLLDYDPMVFDVKVEAGVNFELQRQQAFETLSLLMDRVPLLNQFISSNEQGIEMLLDNIDMRNIDALKQAIPKFIQEINQQQKQQAQQEQAMQQQSMQQQLQLQQAVSTSPVEVEKIRAAQRQEAESMRLQVEAAKIDQQALIDQFKAVTDRLDVLNNRLKTQGQLEKNASDFILEGDKIQAEMDRTAADYMHRHLDRKLNAIKYSKGLTNENEEKRNDAT